MDIQRRTGYKGQWADQSDAYLLQPDDPMLELTVKVININTEARHPLLEKCDVMRQYSIFIDTIRKYQKAGSAEPYKAAIQECIKTDILAEYLRENGSEVINMLQAEYDYEMDIEVQREEAFEDGVAHGEARGEARGETRGLFKGIVSTYKEFHISQMEAIQKLTNSQGISREEAAGYVQRYW